MAHQHNKAIQCYSRQMSKACTAAVIYCIVS